MHLRVDGLTIETLGGSPVLKGISLVIESGTIVGLVGESGSGKTTAGLAMLGYLRKGLRLRSGNVEVDGKDAFALTSAELRNHRGRTVAYVPQDPTSAFNPALRLGEQIAEVLRAHGKSASDARRRVSYLIREVGLSDLPGVEQSYPHQLSGGQLQRIGIAMAFAMNPKVIVLDEPTTGLDVTTQRRIVQMVRDLSREHGATAIYISHDLAVVRQLVDRVVVMKDGRIVEDSPTDTLFARPAHLYTRRLLESVPSLERMRAAGDDHAAAAYVAATEVEPILQARSIRAAYGSKTVLESVDLQVGPGEVLALVGESGSGKSTLARSLIGLHRSWSGELLLSGRPVQHEARRRSAVERQQLQYVFQNPYASLNPKERVYQALLRPLRLLGRKREAHGTERERLERALIDVALDGSYLERYPNELSGGERQRVAIARALVVDPKVLICDEITSALDMTVQAVVIDTLRALRDNRGLSMIFITHNIALVPQIAQRLTVLAGGRIVEQGRTWDVLNGPQAEYTNQLLADAPEIVVRAATL